MDVLPSHLTDKYFYFYFADEMPAGRPSLAYGVLAYFRSSFIERTIVRNFIQFAVLRS